MREGSSLYICEDKLRAAHSSCEDIFARLHSKKDNFLGFVVKFKSVHVLCVPTLLPAPVENLDVFQLYTNASPELHSICCVVFATSLNGAIGMSP